MEIVSILRVKKLSIENSPGEDGEMPPFMLRTERKGTGHTFNGPELVVSVHHEKHSFVNWLQLERDMRFSHLRRHHS